MNQSFISYEKTPYFLKCRYKRALLDNGSTIQVPSYLEAGEKIVINTEDDSFVKRYY
jgi:hypothetical protein